MSRVVTVGQFRQGGQASAGSSSSSSGATQVVQGPPGPAGPAGKSGFPISQEAAAAIEHKLGELAITKKTLTTTSGALPIASFVVPEDSHVRFRLVLSAKKRAANVSASYEIHCAFDRHEDAGASEVGEGSIDSFEREGAEAWEASYGSDGPTVFFYFTGDGSSIDVTSKLDVSVTP